MTQPRPQTEVTDAQWIELCRAYLRRDGTPPDGTLDDPSIPLFDICKPSLKRLLDEAEAEPHRSLSAKKIADVVFAIGVLDVTGRIGAPA